MDIRHLRFREESNVLRRHPQVDPRPRLEPRDSPGCKNQAHERCQIGAIYAREKLRAMANMDVVGDRLNLVQVLAGCHSEELFRKSASASNTRAIK